MEDVRSMEAKVETKAPEKQKSQRDLVYELVKAVTYGRTREAGTHMRDFLTKEEKGIVRTGIYNLIRAGVMRYKKDVSDIPKIKKYASVLICDVFKKDPRYQ